MVKLETVITENYDNYNDHISINYYILDLFFFLMIDLIENELRSNLAF